MDATAPTLVFTTGIDSFQFLVNFATLSPAAHTAIGLGDHLLHANDRGVVLEPRIDWFTRKRQRLVGEFEIVPDVRHGVQRCLGRLGEGYDFPGIVRLTVMIALRHLRSSIGRVGWAPGSAHTCSSFAMLLDPHGDLIPEWRDLDRASVMPVDLLGRAHSGPSFRKLALSIRQL